MNAGRILNSLILSRPGRAGWRYLPGGREPCQIGRQARGNHRIRDPLRPLLVADENVGRDGLHYALNAYERHVSSSCHIAGLAARGSAEHAPCPPGRFGDVGTGMAHDLSAEPGRRTWAQNLGALCERHGATPKTNAAVSADFARRNGVRR